MNTDAVRRLLPSIGLVFAGLVSLLGCGSASSATPSIVTASSATPSVASASSAAPASSAASASASPVIGGVCISTPIKFDPKVIDLTGAWSGDDGGVYYVRQRGVVIWWNGMSSRAAPPVALGREWNNVGRGEIGKDLTIVSDWVDVPRGGIGGYGTVTFKIGPDSSGNLQIIKISETGSGRGDTVWTRCAPGFPS